MLDGQEPTYEMLFEQLGLDSDQLAIDAFIKTHQLPADVKLVDAPFWNEGQRQFLAQQFKQDDNWAIVVDDLNQQLHHDSQEKP
ncbi:DUF2789 domain-containing protein [Acinetobacter qingfengensis]|uniref:Uncharacterized protein n=1 Tax=Acinetobacter qingfengensis TaxID=1262585 RepID=A0A1E7RE31_9GAMM|nr:DUF2789 family protein [Acinetobacter qingfengensis]KAA8734510.1 DUF2789 domain-containing protein [Acinetobacter qingfengensis]OEY97546.1 hypothetical protein BJI46_09335 [Acinetobacter qingfengensis]